MYTPHNLRTGAGAYARLGVETQAMSASPHQLICMLFDGAITAIGLARHHIAEGDVAAKGRAISKAVGIVANGLKASLDAKAAGAAGAELVANLSALYDYVIRRLLQANLRDDPRALDEAESLLENVASAWREVGAAGR
ncbi:MULTISPECIES: flagellar export chaperone FliS [unclassified Variovorax]|uniref:flagellar export chaperone FliS n=1 Tax=unclassified Variovorax TaxID=663243 RepID=UPI00076CCFCE|nr:MULTISPECIES: flagellar export chaperone FliS [unclassified Variovorax]KWT86045.1 Flagellar biosynthesis protein FliS [Variovorax sp. WDL1]PNG46943.1 Flagellar protein FliS [Variovorax sp. B2]PNG48406.1 Flagellar protein FliS [Variovorax sp. B4]VTV14781.1 Flagellar protein FliS [Variovorax sp. WDL1]